MSKLPSSPERRPKWKTIIDQRRRHLNFTSLIEALGWQGRIESLKALPEVLLLLWRAAPGIVSLGLSLRVVAAVIPVAVLGVTRRIIDLIANHKMYFGSAGHFLWPWLLLEFALAALSVIIARGIEYCDLLDGRQVYPRSQPESDEAHG